MNIDELDDATSFNELGWVDILAKAILLDKVSIKDGKITVKAFKENEV